jgi:homoserine kinase type II
VHHIIKEISLFWNLKLKKIREDIHIPGSPERCEFRIVIEDKDDRLFIYEKISHAAYEHKMRIIKTLEFLASQDMGCIQPYIPNKKGEYIARNNHGL